MLAPPYFLKKSDGQMRENALHLKFEGVYQPLTEPFQEMISIGGPQSRKLKTFSGLKPYTEKYLDMSVLLFVRSE
jgi:hypothetical protein